MNTYKVAISGWVEVEVQAPNEAEAKELALQTDVGGQVYDYVIDDVQEVSHD